MCNFVPMNIEELREYCLGLRHVTEEMPFDDVTLVFKVGGKMFCLTSLVGELRISVKCDPDEALEMREIFPAVLPGCHLNKKHWNTVIIDGSISDGMLKVWILKSYNLVVAGLPLKEKRRLGLVNLDKRDK